MTNVRPFRSSNWLLTLQTTIAFVLQFVTLLSFLLPYTVYNNLELIGRSLQKLSQAKESIGAQTLVLQTRSLMFQCFVFCRFIMRERTKMQTIAYASSACSSPPEMSVPPVRPNALRLHQLVHRPILNMEERIATSETKDAY